VQSRLCRPSVVPSRHDVPMGVIYLLRHAQAPAEAYGGPPAAAVVEQGLSALGREQARRAGKALAARIDAFDFVISGDLARQRQTLSIAMESFVAGPGHRLDARWNEYDIDAVLGRDGRAITTTGRALQTMLDKALVRWIAADSMVRQPPETYIEYQKRCTHALESVRQLAGPGKAALVVSSAGTITQIVAQLWGLDDQNWIRMARTMLNASITKLIVGRGGVSVLSTNEHAHLETTTDTGQRPWMTFR
jgi:broad specificity phosphatase PhoE